MTRKEIQSLIRTKGLTQAGLAREAGVTPATFSRYLRRQFKSRPLGDFIDRALGVGTGLPR